MRRQEDWGMGDGKYVKPDPVDTPPRSPGLGRVWLAKQNEVDQEASKPEGPYTMVHNKLLAQMEAALDKQQVREIDQEAPLSENGDAITFARVKAADMGFILTESQVVNILVAAALGARLAAADRGHDPGVTHDGCTYLAPTNDEGVTFCNKCGFVTAADREEGQQ